MAQPRMTFGYWNIRGLAAGARQLLVRVLLVPLADECIAFFFPSL